jgi:hypothetical protein
MKLIATSINILVSRVKRVLPILFLLFIVSIFSNILIAQNNKTFTIGSIEAKSGEKVSGSLIVERGIDEGTFIPITIINGAKSGPVLTLVAGVHGTEYVPVIALQEIVNEINPKDLNGTLVLVHIANVLAFRNRIPYVNPVDSKNLNRLFPGKENGTISERIAYTITNEIAKKSDYFIDLHGGEFNERVLDYLYFYYDCPDPELNEKSKLLAHAFENKYLIPFDYKWIPDSLLPEYCDFAALRQGTAAITLEWGDRGIALQEEIELANKGIINVLKTVKMLAGEPFVNKHAIYIYNENTVNSNYDGILYTKVDKGQFIKKGTLIGYTTDYW